MAAVLLSAAPAGALADQEQPHLPPGGEVIPTTATPEDLSTPDIVRAAERMSQRGVQQVRRFAPVRRNRSLQRMGLAVRKAMRRVRRLQAANARRDS